MEKAYKGMMGGYSILKEDDKKHLCTHVILKVRKGYYKNYILTIGPLMEVIIFGREIMWMQ